ncbi:hypothetical protein ACJMK2_025828 [Sinanodonta woodiana]|uniref:Uncharacterized protein n=1 Tax=Sinanodonta woodiana TaxID=1069815 RepID=A0ABD3XLF7_SINWO
MENSEAETISKCKKKKPGSTEKKRKEHSKKKMVPYRHSWAEALEYCRRYGARLAEPTGPLMSDWLAIQARLQTIDKYWIGYNRQYTVNQDFDGYWSDGTYASNEVGVWGPFEPNTRKGQCTYVSVSASSSQNSLWYMDRCDLVMASVCQLQPCPSDTKRCYNGLCIGKNNLCNGKDDCGDGSDEMECVSRNSFYYNGTSGTVRSHDTGSYYAGNTARHWIIEGAVGSQIQITFNKFETEKDVDYLEIREGGPTLATSRLVGRFSGTLPDSYRIVSSNNFLIGSFISDADRNYGGFEFQWSTRFACTVEKISQMKEAPGQSVTVRKLSLQQTVSLCINDVLTVGYKGFSYDGTKRECYLLQEIPAAVTSTCCDLYVRTCPNSGSVTTVDSIPKLNSTLTAVDSARQLYTPLYPVFYTGNQELTHSIITTGNAIITMEILDVDLCCEDNVTIYDGLGPESEVLITLKNGSSPAVVMTTGSSAYIYMYLKEHMSCRGLLMTYRRGCDFHINADNGTVFTPGYGIGSYPGVLFCSWLIQTTNGGRMTLMFEAFDLGDLDYLKVYDGVDEQATPLHTGHGLTGLVLPSTIRSSGQGLFLKLSTGALGNNDGFMATFSADCSGVNSPSLNIVPSASLYVYQSVISVSCATGYYFTGENKNAVTLTCTLGGKWDKPFPDCARASCGPVSDIQNGYIVSTTGIMGGDRTTYACRTGFNMVGSATISCDSTATWGASPECRSVSCPLLQTTLVNGHVQTVIGGQDHGSVVIYSCDEYYELYGASSVQCSFGSWSSSPPTCRRIRCKDNSVENGVLNVTTPNRGEPVLLQCNSGYTPSGKNPFICGVDNLPVCNNTNECTAGTHQCVNAYCVDTEGSYTCKCKPGYQPSVYISTQCNDVDECAVNGGNGYCSYGCQNTIGGYQCFCQTGYRLYTYNGFQDLFLLIGEDGSKPWHRFYINHTCVPVQCGNLSLNVIANGNVLNPKSSYFFMDTLTYICDPGYTINNGIQGIINMYCQLDGSWTGTGTGIPRCIAKTCTDIQSYSVNVSQLSYKNQYTRQCPLPNSKIVQLTRYCGYDRTTRLYKTVGQDLNTCPVLDCGMPQDIAGARQYTISCTTYNCGFQFQCRPSYERQGNSTRGSDMVYCESDGSWGFGNIHCIGGQCPDPGYPPDGAMVATSFEEGSLVSFTCKKTGFQPDPSWPIKCQQIGGTMQWNSSIPVCKDKQPPQFINCPTDIRVKRFQEPIFTEPTAVDNVGVTSFRVLPSNFRPRHPLEATTTITYEAYDFESNSNQCKFTIAIIDEIKPSLFCFVPQVILVTNANFYQQISPFPDLAYSDEPRVNLTAYPTYIEASPVTIGRAEVIKVVAQDASGNQEECNIQFKIEGQKCSSWALKVDHGRVTCNSKSVGTGYDCRIICDSGYYFFENPNLSYVDMACYTGFDWDRNPPVCQAGRSVKFRSVTRLQYRTNLAQVSNIPDCINQYRQYLVSRLTTLTSQLTTYCQLDASVSVITPSDQNVQVIQMSNNQTHTYATITLEIGPDGSDNTVFTNCANKIYAAFNQNTSYVSSISSIPVSGTCPSGTLDSAAQLPGTTFYCSDFAQPFDMTSQNRHICVLCPIGYLQVDGRTCQACPAGTYRDLTSSNECLACPSGTHSETVGAKNIYDCYLTCPYGMYSASGQAPCSDCGMDTYRTSSTRCEPCPAGKGTRGSGKTSASDCIAECPVGYFSSDGLSPCTACPVAFYQAIPQQDTCSECPDSLTTSSAGSTTSTACINGSPILCSPNPCNTGICQVIDHDYFCVCNASYTGRNCEIEKSPCDSSPCYNGGRCNKVSLTSYTCACNGTFYGDRCQNDVQQCTTNQCKNNGTCSDRISGIECMCPTYSGYNGQTCQDPRNPCTQYPVCQNGGTCIPHGSFYRTCKCLDGFTGYQCETNIDECTSSPCINGGTCVDGINGFSCSCPVGYSGPFCAYISEANVVCSANPCTGIGEICVNQYVNETKYCICPLGYSYNQSTGRCEDIEKCSSLACQNLGSCFSIDYGYNTLCDCRDGYAGTLCQYNYNECSSDPCKNGALCTDLVNGYACSCSTGTGGKNCELDTVNECVSGSCSVINRVQCLDLINAYKCICREGYTGTDCTVKIPSCQSYPCQHGGTCSETSTSYTCTCALPWTGPNCQTLVDNCLAYNGTRQCKNNALCYSSNSSFVCNCTGGYRGDYCEMEYNLCKVANPCMGSGSNCSIVNANTQCSCAVGYSGSYCQQTSICDSTTCSNGGTCSIVNGIVKCTCPAGYTSSRCEDEINECLSNPCPPGALCRNNIASYTCVCPQGKVGDDCDKDFSYNFDIVYVPSTSCAVTSMPFGDPQKNITAFTVSLWVRFTKLSTTGTILNILSSNNYTIPASSPFQLTISAEDVVMKTLTSTGSYRPPVVINTFTSSLMDGLWHHVAVTWNRTSARIKVFKDGSEVGSSTANFNLLPIGHVVLGYYSRTDAEIRAEKSFEGRLSRLLILDTEYSASQINSLYTTRAVKVTGLVLNPLDSLMKLYKVDYSSQLSNNFCIPGGSNCTGLFDGTTFPTVRSCVQDQYSVTARDVKPQWTSPVFEKYVRAKQTLSSGDTVLSWGVYGIGFAAYSENDNAAVCTFRFFNKRANCSLPSGPSGGSKSCTTIEGGSRCTLTCNNVNYIPWDTLPTYSTCSRYSSWGRDDGVTPYRFPACSVVGDLTNNLYLTLRYDVAGSCDASKAISLFRNSLSTVNTQWQQGLCSGASCSAIPVGVTCDGANSMILQASFPLIKNTLSSSAAGTLSPVEVLKVTLVDEKSLNITNYTPDLSTLDIRMVSACATGYQVSGSNCVECGAGSKYVSGMCMACAKGEYQSASKQLSCITCDAGKTTESAGSISSSDCLLSCFTGKFYNKTLGNCDACPAGFYQDNTGSFYCKACAAGYTTQFSGSSSINDCKPSSGITTTPPPDLNADTGKSTAGGEALSGAIIAIIVLAIGIGLIIIFIVIFCFCRDKLPCQKKVTPIPKAVDKKQIHGEISVRAAKYNMSNRLNDKDREPIIPEDSVSNYIETSYSKAPPYTQMDNSFSLKPGPVPIFTERMNGSVQKKTWISSRASQLSTDVESEAVRRTPDNYQKHRGRRPANLPAPHPSQLPRSLPPLSTRSFRSLPPTDPSLRPSSGLNHARIQLEPEHYQDFLDSQPVRRSTPTMPPQGFSPQSSVGSYGGVGRIYLESDEEV